MKHQSPNFLSWLVDEKISKDQFKIKCKIFIFVADPFQKFKIVQLE